MGLKLGAPDMPVLENLSTQVDFSGSSIIMIQHGIRDAIDFGLMLQNKSHAEVIFLPKPFSQNQKDLAYGQEQGLKIHYAGNDYVSGLEREGFLESILEQYCDKILYIVEVGGLFAKTFQNPSNIPPQLQGIVEVTTFGHTRHLDTQTNTRIPTYSIARSSIKEKEAKYVGLAVFRSVDRVLHELNRALVDCNITMVGYGMIGENMCKAFALCKRVSVIDHDMEKVFQAQQDGIPSNTNFLGNIENTDIVISSTGYRAITKEFIKACKSGVLLVSAGSRQNEIDIEFLEKNTQHPPEFFHEFLKKYIIDGKEIFLFREGKNANFSLNSCPSSSMDLIHSEVLMCLENLQKRKYKLGVKLNETSQSQKQKLLSLSQKYWE